MEQNPEAKAKANGFRAVARLTFVLAKVSKTAVA